MTRWPHAIVTSTKQLRNQKGGLSAQYAEVMSSPLRSSEPLRKHTTQLSVPFPLKKALPQSGEA